MSVDVMDPVSPPVPAPISVETTETPRAPQTAAEWNAVGVATGEEQAGIWSNLGNALAELKQYARSLAAHRQALKLAPEDEKCRENMVTALISAGVALRRAKRHAEAIECYREAVTLAPKHAVAWANLGNVVFDLARRGFPADPRGRIDFTLLPANHAVWRHLDEAVICHRRAMEFDGTGHVHFKERLASVLNARGVARRARRPLLRSALADCQEAARLNPDNAGIWTNLGNIYKDLKFCRTAIACHQRAIALDPYSADHHFNLAVAYATDMRSEEALASIETALTFRPNDPHLRWDRALNNLRLGRYVEGWRDYEARLETGALPERNPPGKPWRGEPYAGQRLLVVSEQGYGDTIWASRYLSRVKALGGELVVECREAMVPLIRHMGVADRVIAKGSGFPEADWHINICSIPGLFVENEADISREPYLTPPTDRVEKAQAAIGDAGGKLKVGIVWSGSTTFKANHDRAVPLRYFLEAFALPGVQLYSLQKGPPVAELKNAPPGLVIDLGTAMADFADAAAVVA
jgi:tetratricopeptide (TPR) repeat protein